MSDKYVSQREFAKHINRSHVWVNRLVKEGKLPANEKGQIPLQDGLRAYEASKVAGYEGNREWGEKQRAAGKVKREAGEQPVAEPVAKHEQQATSDMADLPTTVGAGMSIARINEQFNRARLAEKTYQAKLKELEFKEASGQLIPVGDVEADAERTGAEVRERLMTVAPRVAGLCEGKTAREIERIIEEAINDALEALQRARFGGRKGK